MLRSTWKCELRANRSSVICPYRASGTLPLRFQIPCCIPHNGSPSLPVDLWLPLNWMRFLIVGRLRIGWRLICKWIGCNLGSSSKTSVPLSTVEFGKLPIFHWSSRRTCCAFHSRAMQILSCSVTMPWIWLILVSGQSTGDPFTSDGNAIGMKSGPPEFVSITCGAFGMANSPSKT